jgi:hypothetical protein
MLGGGFITYSLLQNCKGYCLIQRSVAAFLLFRGAVLIQLLLIDLRSNLRSANFQSRCLILTIHFAQQRAIVTQYCCYIWVTRLQRFLPDGERSLQEGFRLFILSMRVVKCRQIVEALSRVWMIWSQLLLFDLQRSQ